MEKEREETEEEEEDEREILLPYEIEFSDLLLLSSDEQPSSSSLAPVEIERLELITRTIMENLGPTGPGLIAITGVPIASTLRRTLLPLARELALLNFEDRKRVLKEHGLGSDVPLKNLDRTVSPFAMQLKYDQCVDITNGKAGLLDVDGHKTDENCIDTERLGEFQESKFKNLRNAFQDLGYHMIELGCHLARVCDGVIGGQELEQSLLESCTAKGRLIHYHSTLDNLILKESSKRKGSTKGHSNVKSLLNGSNGSEKFIRNEQTSVGGSVGGHGTKSIGNQSSLWQQWHYDYGIFTVLTDPMFMLPYHPQTTKAIDCSCISCEELPSPSGHSYLQIYHPNKNSVLMVKVSPDSFIVQVGESADILSKGKLRATLHSVGRPPKQENLSRENFVVFLQPAWSKTFSLLDYPVECSTSSDWQSGKCTEESCAKQDGKPTQETYKIVPPLSARLKDGMTFAEFSRETTKQYYGGSGLQSKG